VGGLVIGLDNNTHEEGGRGNLNIEGIKKSAGTTGQGKVAATQLRRKEKEKKAGEKRSKRTGHLGAK